jgi:hypothetical protein
VSDEISPKLPLALVEPPKLISVMTDEERHVFAAELFGKIAATRRPARESPDAP